MNRFDITVVIPTFNAEKTVGRCLESVLCQRGVTVEVIVVDGGSSDNTLSIVRRLVSANAVIISEPDQGIYDAINKGVSLAKGALIGVLGADDVYRSDILSIVKAKASGGKEIIAGLTTIDGQQRLDEPYRAAALLSGIPFGHNAMFASREAYEAVGLYDLGYRICADAEWVHRAIRMKIPCLKVEQVFVEFGTEGTSSTNPEEIMSEAYSVIQRSFPFLSQVEAKTVLHSVRRWQRIELVNDIFRKYRNISPLFARAALEAFPHLQDDGPEGFHSRFIAPFRRILSRLSPGG